MVVCYSSSRKLVTAPTVACSEGRSSLRTSHPEGPLPTRQPEGFLPIPSPPGLSPPVSVGTKAGALPCLRGPAWPVPPTPFPSRSTPVAHSVPATPAPLLKGTARTPASGPSHSLCLQRSPPGVCVACVVSLPSLFGCHLICGSFSDHLT